MNTDARLQLTMSQKLVMTPMLQQAIKLLQMSRLELVDLIKQELLENPVLDEIENLDDDLTREEPAAASDRNVSLLEESSPEAQSETPFLDVIGLEKGDRQPESTINWEDYFADNPAGLGSYDHREFDDQTQSYESMTSQPQSLADHLNWQLQMAQISDRLRRIGAFLIGQIDDDGYVHGDDPASASEESGLHLTPEELRAARARVVIGLQQKINAEFEREYLAATIDRTARHGMLAMLLSQEYYDDLSQQRYRKLVEKLQRLTIADVEQIGRFIAELPVAELEGLIGIPAADIEPDLATIQRICRDLRHVIDAHLSDFLKDKYDAKLEKIGLPAEELYLVEYILMHLAVEEIAYVGSQENSAKASKREKEVHALLERLQQSYAHVEHLQSRKYALIQLYRIGIGILLDQLKTDCPPSLQKLVFKVSDMTADDVNAAAAYIATLLAVYHEQTGPVTAPEIEQALALIQTFSPPGVGARDMKECLMLQAQDLGLSDIAFDVIIHQFLPILRQGHYAKIAELSGLAIEEVELIAKILANMSLKPGSDFSKSQTEYIVPDVYVYKIDGEYEVVLNEDELPYLRINPLYKKLIVDTQSDVPPTTKQYIDQKLRSAMWFIRSVEQRKRTVYKVGKSLVKFQREFLEHGLSHLKPLVLRDVADDIAMHESTVSRVTTNKYIHTPQGVFEMKYFFHSGLESSAGGSDVSSIAVKERIRQLIDGEDPARPLSDKTLEKILKQDGIAIARRTIAKYREELNIPSSLDRKHA